MTWDLIAEDEEFDIFNTVTVRPASEARSVDMEYFL